MADVQVHPTGIEACPADVIVPGSAEWLLKVCYAHFDGTGAGGSFKPLVRIKSDAGTVVAESAMSETVAAGASADCTWFPDVATAAAGGATVAPDWGTYFIDSVSVNAGGRATSKWHFNAGSALLTIPGIGSPTFVARGVYTVSAWIQSTDAWTATALGAGRLDFGSPTSFEQRQTGGVDAGGTMRNFGIQLTAQANAGATVEVQFENFDTAARNMFSNQVLVQQVYLY